jgi:hypothetical protein
MTKGEILLLMFGLIAEFGLGVIVRHNYKIGSLSGTLLALGLGGWCGLTVTYSLATTLLYSFTDTMLRVPLYVGIVLIVLSGIVKVVDHFWGGAVYFDVAAPEQQPRRRAGPH